jgi:hypothetical protein
MKNLSSKLRNRRKYVLLGVLVVWFGVLGLVAYNQQSVWDWWKLRSYHAPAAVAALASDDTMTPYARKVFYVNAPQLESKDSFNKFCSANSEQTIVLGCYHGGQNGIYVLKVTDSRLTGVEQVTAAHEMLHAAYDRLGANEKNKVDAMLMDYYDHDLHDQRILDTIAAYRKSEPNDVVNEMHSIFGTEIATLPRGLENYYKQYFTNRAEVAAFAAQYQGAFTSRQAAVKQYDAELGGLKSQIASAEADAQAKEVQLALQQAELQKERSSGNTVAYNAGVPAYNAQVAAYNAVVANIRSLVARYNQLVDSRNAIALEEQQLVSDISSNVSPINKQ